MNNTLCRGLPQMLVAILLCGIILSCSKRPVAQQIPSVREQQENSEALGTEAPLRIGILHFENITRDESLKALSRFLSNAFMQTLSQSRLVSVVEREELDRVMAELLLNDSAVIDPDTAQQIGKILGVQALFYGGYFQFGKYLHFNGHLYRVETGEAITSLGGHSTRGDGEALVQLVQHLSDGMIDSIRRQSAALHADRWYEKGRNAEADGNTEAARQFYMEALRFHPEHIGSLTKLGATLPNPKQERITIAVLPFTIESENAGFNPLSLGLIDLFTTELSKTPQLKIVERQQLSKIMRELNLNQRSVIDPETRQRLRKLLGASLLCYGNIVDVVGQVQVTLKMTRTETGKIIAWDDYCDSDRFADKLPQLVEKTARKMRDYVNKNHACLIGDIYYEQGRNAEADGDYEKAKQKYKQALEACKDHSGAKDRLANL